MRTTQSVQTLNKLLQSFIMGTVGFIQGLNVRISQSLQHSFWPFVSISVPYGNAESGLPLWASRLEHTSLGFTQMHIQGRTHLHGSAWFHWGVSGYVCRSIISALQGFYLRWVLSRFTVSDVTDQLTIPAACHSFFLHQTASQSLFIGFTHDNDQICWVKVEKPMTSMRVMYYYITVIHLWNILKEWFMKRTRSTPHESSWS